MPRRTLAHVLLDHVAADGDRLAFEYLHDDGRLDTLTYRELLDRATRVARRLREESGGGPALLLYPPGLDFVVAVYGCFLAGVPAVPTYPPLFGAADRIKQRFERVLVDSRATALLADPFVLAMLTSSGAPEALPPVVTVDQDTPSEGTWDALPEPEDVALVQYTSGSTNQPKGVVLDHRNLIANIEAISAVFKLDEGTRAISWLPPYHDMGLIGFILTPVHGGFPVRLMSPIHFLKNPLEWIRQIGELGVTHTGAPNFGYDLCVRRAAGKDLSGVDLSGWRLAFNGAEPIRARTLAAFADRFAGNGFSPEAFLPCYGLAEATLIVTGGHWTGDDVDADGRVDCGPVIAGHDLVVADPESGTPVDGVEGEIWVSGPSVSRGYLNDTGQPEGELVGYVDGRRYLRTGDLGYLRDGHLFVTGRRKDVLIQHGVNHHAHDLEAAAVLDNPVLRPTAAAFTVDDDQELVLAVELAKRDVADLDELAVDVRARVLAATGARVDTVVLCPPGAIPRTTSGKIQRALTRTRHLAGELTGTTVSTVARVPETDLREPVELFLAEVFAAVCDVDDCAPTQTLSGIGGDSIRGAEIAAITEDALDLPVSIGDVLQAQSPRELAGRLLARWAEDGVTGTEVVDRIGALATAQA
ncbi:AMP-binding protein [Umezawaea tangerina]|uniref:Acyl-CoA synthetase (AMP-forming)/AMP-acid ligase II n=1 Tax=Umezawaea tangerina TaxID=84725 RepID=A0A2T0THK9_9PSEU|nr:AMP-binding protein [Umezawaea tangerina]PRY45202.1 acyl-CoA synthetase (AMP-forming)/AMP-acid ligase II [Umezawaea tangerina]